MNRKFWSAILLVVVLPCCASAFDLLEIVAEGGSNRGESNGGGCNVALSADAVKRMSDVEHWVAPSKIIIGTGRPKSGTTMTLARLAEALESNEAAFKNDQGEFVRKSPNTIATAQLVQVGKEKDESILLVDVDSIGTRPERSECITKALTILSIVPGGALLLSDFEQVTTGTLEIAEALARRAEIFQLSVDDPDASALIAALVAPSSTEPSSSRHVQSKIPESTGDRQVPNGEEEQVPTSTPHLLLLVASKASQCAVPVIRESDSEEGLAGLFDDVGTEEVQGVRQVFESLSTAVVPHSALCPSAMDTAYSAMATRITKWSPPSGTQLKSAGVLAVLQFVLAHAECCYPALPSVWAAWAANVEHAAVDHAVRLFVAELTFAVQHVAHPRAQRHLLAPADAAAASTALAVPEMIDTEVAHRVFDLPSQSEFQLAVESLRQGASDRVSKLLFKMNNKRATSTLIKRLDVEEKRIQAELKQNAIITILDFSESCVAAAGREDEIKVLPISTAVVDAWAQRVRTGCMNVFETHLGKFKDMAPVEFATQYRRLGVALSDQHKAMTKRNDEKLAHRLQPALGRLVDSIWPSFSDSEAMPTSQVEKQCELGGERLVASWKQAAVSAVGAFVTSEKIFTELEKQGRGELSEKCSGAKRENLVKVSKYLKHQVEVAFRPFSAELDRIRFPDDPDEIDVVFKNSRRQADDDFADGTQGYSLEEVRGEKAALQLRFKEKEAEVQSANTNAWEQKLPEMKICTTRTLTDAVKTTSFFTASAVIEATKTISQECFRKSSDSTRRDIPKRVLASVLEKWNNERFFVDHQRDAMFRLELMGFGAVLAGVGALFLRSKM